MKKIHFLFCMLFSSSVFSATLEGMRLDEAHDHTSVYFMLNSSAKPKIFLLANPHRLVLDFPNTTLRFPLREVGVKRQLINGLRSGEPSPHTLRLVLELNSHVHYQLSSWTPPVQGHQGLQLVLRNQPPLSRQSTQQKSALSPPPHKMPVVGVTTAPTPIYQAMKPTKPVKTAYPSGRLRDVIVAIDAGHGGKDPGAMGPTRKVEKNVTLGIAMKLKQVIDRQPGMRAVLTRRGDYYIALRERLNMARRAKADIFVSIHADAFKNQESHGASVFALSARGATSEAARWLAEKENYSELGGVNLKGIDDTSGWVRSVLIDLSQTATINASLAMGSQVLRQLGGFTPLHNHRVEQAGFLVLKSPDTPSILVETGFISNPREERNLTSQAYQSRLAQAIFQGLNAYFIENPPHGTRFELASMRR